MRRTHQARFQGCGGLERKEFVHQGGVDPSAELGQYLREHALPLGPINLHLPNPARLPHRQIRPQLATDLLIRTVQFLFE